jgi:hypothetical protein
VEREGSARQLEESQTAFPPFHYGRAFPATVTIGLSADPSKISAAAFAVSLALPNAGDRLMHPHHY